MIAPIPPEYVRLYVELPLMRIFVCSFVATVLSAVIAGAATRKGRR